MLNSGMLKKYKQDEVNEDLRATDVEKVLEELVLNGKVQFTLDEILKIAKHDFHEVIIDVMKEKKQTINDAMTSNLQGKKGVGDGSERDKNTNANASCIDLIEEKGEIQASSHIYQKNSWGILYGDCSKIKVMIEDRNDEQNFLLQNSSTYPIILRQPYITTT